MTEWIELIVWVVVILALIWLFMWKGKSYFRQSSDEQLTERE
jgi:hypothetical protein